MSTKLDVIDLIRAEDSDAIAQLATKLKNLDRERERVKLANKLARKVARKYGKPGGWPPSGPEGDPHVQAPDEACSELAQLLLDSGDFSDCSTYVARKMLEPPYSFQKPGAHWCYPTNMAAQARRLKKRIAELQADAEREQSQQK